MVLVLLGFLKVVGTAMQAKYGPQYAKVLHYIQTQVRALRPSCCCSHWRALMHNCAPKLHTLTHTHANTPKQLLSRRELRNSPCYSDADTVRLATLLQQQQSAIRSGRPIPKPKGATLATSALALYDDD